jgi:uncharacterized repeat protein (TIGR03803 family)
MRHIGLSAFKSCGLTIATVCLMFAGRAVASGPAETTLYAFGSYNGDAGQPTAPVIFDTAGNLYGTTAFGGEFGYGAVFELTPPAIQGGAWTEKILYHFTGTDGSQPSSGLIFDSRGALYGEAIYGGYNDAGVVFKLTPPAMQGGAWIESTVYGFCPTGDCTDGQWPSGGLVFKEGNLYGTAQTGGYASDGVIFELTRPHDKRTTWTESVLYTFGSENGRGNGYIPQTGVIFDEAGNLYGTTMGGGSTGYGVVFELASTGGVWTESVLYNFQGLADGFYPEAGLVFDKLGSLHGTTSAYGASNGTVFKLSPPQVQGGTWTESVLYSFKGFGALDGSNPTAGVIFDGKDLFGTTTAGGTQGCAYNIVAGGCGTVFKLTPPKSGTGAWAEKILWDCSLTDSGGGYYPAAPLKLRGGAFYGTTSDNIENRGGFCQSDCGAVFKLVP